MASDDSEDEIFFGPVISTKERKKMERLRDRKTLIIDGRAGPLYRLPSNPDGETFGTPAHVIQSSVMGTSPTSQPLPNARVDSAVTPTRPRQSLLTVQQVLGEAGCPTGVISDQEDLKQAGPVNRSPIIASEDEAANASGMDYCELTGEQIETGFSDDMDCNNVEAVPNAASDVFSARCVTDVGLVEISPHILIDETSADADHVSSLSFDLKCTNESSVYVTAHKAGKDSVLSSGYNPQPPFDFSQHVTGFDHQQALTPLPMLDDRSAVAKENPAASVDKDVFSDFSHHDPSLYPVPAVHCDYSYLSNRFSIISTATDIDGSNACPLSLPATTINTTTSTDRNLISPSQAVDEPTSDDSEIAQLEEQKSKEPLCLSFEDGVSPTLSSESDSTTSSSLLAVNPSLSSEMSLKTNPYQASLQSSMESSLVTPPPFKSHMGRLSLKVPSFSALSPDEMVTPPPLQRQTRIAEEADKDVATSPKTVVFGLDDFEEDNSTSSPVTPEDDGRRNSSVAASVSGRASSVLSVEDLSRMLDHSSLNLLAEVALAEHEESLAVVEESFKHPDGMADSPCDAEHHQISVSPMAITPRPGDLRHHADGLTSKKFVNEYLSPRSGHQAATPDSTSSAVAPATTPCSPAREKFLAFARQWKVGNNSQKSPFSGGGGGIHDVEALKKHRVVRNMCEELGTDDEMDTSEQNKLPDGSMDSVVPGPRPSSYIDNIDNEVTSVDVDESVVLNNDPVKEGAAHVVQAIESGEENRSEINCTKLRMSFFSALDVIDVGKRELFGTFITEEGESNTAENITLQSMHPAEINGADSSTIEGENILEHCYNETSDSLRSRTATERDQEKTAFASDQHQQSMKTVGSDQYQQNNSVFVDAQAGPSGMQATTTYSSCDDTSYLEDYPSDCSRGHYDTSYDSGTGHPEPRFNDTLEQMELLLQASEKYKLEQAALQQQRSLDTTMEASGSEDQPRSIERRLPMSVDGNVEQLLTSVDGNDGQFHTSVYGSERQLSTSVDVNDGNLSCNSHSDRDATLANESISICDVGIDETNDGNLEGLNEADVMEEDDTSGNDDDDYTVLSPKKRTIASEVFSSAFNPTMDSTHASCARLTPELPTLTQEYATRAPSSDGGQLPHYLPSVLDGNRGPDSIQDGNGKVVVGNACVVEVYEEFDESTDLVENSTAPTHVGLTATNEIMNQMTTAPFIPSSSYGSSKETPVKPPRKINATKADIRSLPVAVVSPSITRSSSATREASSGRYAASSDKICFSASDVHRSSNITSTNRSQSASRLHLTSPGGTKTTPLTSMTSRRSPASGSRLHSAQQSFITPNSRGNIHKPSSTGNLPRSVDNKVSCSQSPFMTPSRPMTTPNKYSYTTSHTASRPSHTSSGLPRTTITSHSAARYMTPQSRPVVRQVPGVQTTGSARKVHVAGATSGSRVKQLAVATKASRVMSPVARSLLVNPPPPLLTTVKPRTGIAEHRLKQSAAESSHASGTLSASSARSGSVATPRRVPTTPSATISRLNQIKIEEDLNSSMQQRVAKIERIQKGLDRLTAKPPQVGSSASPSSESPSCPPSSPTTRRCPILPPAFYSQPSNQCLEGNKENERLRRPCCAHDGGQEGEVTKPQVLRHTGRVLMPQSAEAANTSHSMMEVSVCERHSITYTDTLRDKQHH